MEIQLVDARNCEILEERELLLKQMRDWATPKPQSTDKISVAAG